MDPKIYSVLLIGTDGAIQSTALNSFVNQETANWNFIIVDNGSTDSSVAKLKSYLGTTCIPRHSDTEPFKEMSLADGSDEGAVKADFSR